MVALSATPAAGSALVSLVLEASAVTAACWDTGAFMSTDAVRATALGIVTLTLVTAFLGKSQGFIPHPYVCVLKVMYYVKAECILGD